MRTLWTLTLLLLGYELYPQTNIYFGNLHSHTSYSDGVETPEIAFDHARNEAKLDFLAITEHNHYIEKTPGKYARDNSSLVKTAMTKTIDGKFVALYGQEFSSISKGNHANVLEVGEIIKTSEVANGRWDLLLNNWLPSHKDSQGKAPILLLNHPATSSSPNNLEYGKDDFSDANWIPTLDQYAHLINIVNGPSHDQSQPGSPSFSEFRRYLNLGLHVAPTADQDNHRHNWGSAAETRTAVLATELTRTAILEALRNRNVYATEDKNLEIRITVNGRLIGAIFEGNSLPSSGTELDIKLDISDPDEPFAIYKLEVFKDEIGGNRAESIKELDFNGDTKLEIPGINYSGGNEYLFFRINQTDDDGVIIHQAWTAPVWFSTSEATTPVETGVILSLNIDVFDEEATITNLGNQALDLKGYELISLKGGQKFSFDNSTILSPGKTIIITSGRFPQTGDNMIHWTDNNVWNNSGSDPGRLVDEEGNIVAETGS